MNSINHIHIPRCSGIYIKTHIVNDLKVKKIPYFATNHEEISQYKFENAKFISGHFGLTPLKYNKDLINVCLLRDPVDRFISNFIYLYSGYKGPHLESKLEEWIENPKQHNLQAKNLSSVTNEELYNSLNHGTLRALEGWCLENTDIDINKTKQFIDSIEIIDTLDNHNSFISKLNDLCYKVYGFYSFSNKNLINANFQTIKISDSMKARIEEVNYLDMEVYEYVKSTR